jgi:D-alanyl-D-alanine carboxypeptidase/D-alanyl-D-alanine-endopeptidase (penicillin-binding protein 4)
VRPVRGRTIAIVALVAVAAFIAAFGITRSSRTDRAESFAPRPTLPRALNAIAAEPPAPVRAATAPAPTAAGVRKALAKVTAAPGLGGRLLARVVDARTGAVLYDRNGATPAAPASTGKLLTAAAILAVHGPSDRFATRVVDAGDGTIVLVGGGDPTLAAAAPGRPTVYPGAARISDLAAQVRHAGVIVHRIVVDGSLFTGPAVAPSWDPSDMGTTYAAPITAIMSDAGQIRSAGFGRSGNPDLSAGAALAKLLGRPDLPVSRGTAPHGAKQLAVVQSAPLSELIDEMLQNSDNVIADVLARQVALAEHRPASFTGATAAIRTVLGRLGVQVGAGMRDGSGLSSADRVSPAALVGVLRLVARGSSQLSLIASELPVGGWSGTLDERYTTGRERRVAGRVRAKTGTLTAVSSLAGLVHDASGRLLVFSFDADRAVSTYAADAALDAIVTALARCGCR